MSTIFLSACSVATPEVTSLLSNLTSFKLTSNEIRIQSLSELSSIAITADCNATNLSFDYELTDTAPGVWNPLPASPTGFFTSISELCSSSSTLSMTLDLSSTPPFSTMALGETKTLKFRDENLFNLSSEQEFRVVYSQMKLAEDQFSNGQGLSDIKTSGSYSLKGRITNIQQVPTSVSGTYTLQGRVLFE